MENAPKPGPGKKPTKRTPARPAASTAKTPSTRKPAAKRPAAKSTGKPGGSGSRTPAKTPPKKDAPAPKVVEAEVVDTVEETPAEVVVEEATEAVAETSTEDGHDHTAADAVNAGLERLRNLAASVATKPKAEVEDEDEAEVEEAEAEVVEPEAEAEAEEPEEVEPEAEAEAEPEAEVEEPEAEAEPEPETEPEPEPETEPEAEAEEAEAEAEPEPEPEAEAEAEEPETEPEAEAEAEEPEPEAETEPEEPESEDAEPEDAEPEPEVEAEAEAEAEPEAEEKPEAEAEPEAEEEAEAEPEAEAEEVEVEAEAEPEAEEADDEPEGAVEPEPETEPEPEPEPAASTELEVIDEAALAAIGVDTVLYVKGLTKHFDETLAVDELNLEVKAGAFYGIVGPNGAGKTTTLSMITGLLRPDAGAIYVHGAEVWKDPTAAKRNMGVLPDRLRLFDRLTGAQLLHYAGVLRGLDSAVVKTRTADLARAFGLEDALGRLVSDYSAGMTKKIALAAAMIHSPRLLVLDEPFESVDPVSAATVTEILKKYVSAGGTVVLSSHSMDLVERICDHVIVIVHGRVLADGTVDEVRNGQSLEERFIELVGGSQSVEGLEWLHTFSD